MRPMIRVAISPMSLSGPLAMLSADDHKIPHHVRAMATLDPSEVWREWCVDIVEVLNLWFEIELGTHMLLATILKTKTQLAIALLSSVSGPKAQRDIILNCASCAYSREPDLKKIETILKRLSIAARRRNQLMHGLLSFHPSYPYQLAVTNRYAKADPALIAYEIITKQEMKRIKNQFSLLRADIHGLIRHLKKAKRQSLLGTRL